VFLRTDALAAGLRIRRGFGSSSSLIMVSDGLPERHRTAVAETEQMRSVMRPFLQIEARAAQCFATSLRYA
jgi:hypothetical protein